MIASALVENIVARYADAIRRDAEALLWAAAWPDLPAGVAILPIGGNADAGGVSIGSGHALAIAHGCRPGAVAVRVDVVGTLRESLAADPDDPAVAVDVGRQLSEWIAVHEMAHALTGTPDRVATVAEAAALVAGAEARPVPPLRQAASHGPRWAAAVVTLARRVSLLRPVDQRRGMFAAMRRDLACHGLDAEAVAEALGDVADDAPLRELLAEGGDVACRVAAVCRPAADRAAIIEQRLADVPRAVKCA